MSLDLVLKDLESNFNMRNSRQHCTYEFEDFRLDAATRLLYRDGEQLSLSPKAVETLIALLERYGEVVGKDELMQTIWGDTIVEESNLAQYLHVLRKILGKTSDGRPYIETLKRRGYRFNGAVRVLDGADRSSLPAEHLHQPRSEPSDPDALARRVERRGNVLALADWAVTEEKVETDRNGPARRPQRTIYRWLAFAAFPALALLTVFLAFSALRPSAVVADQPQAVESDLTITPLTNAEVVDQATISPDGEYFAYVEEGSDARIWLQEVGGSSRIKTVEVPGVVITCITFAPDSGAIYYLASHEGEKVASLYRVGALGGVPTRILTGINGPASFSPDGGEIAFVRQDPRTPQTQLVVAASDGSKERVLLERAGTGLIEPNAAWSPDGKQIAVGVMNTERSITTCSLIAVDPSDDSIKPLSDEKWDTCHRSAWLNDGSGLVFVGTKFKEAVTTRRDQVYYLPVASGVSRRLTNSGNRHEPWSLGVTRSNEILALPYSRISQIWSLDIGADAQTAKQITSGQSDGRGGIEALADGSIFYLARAGEGFGIFRTNAADGRASKAVAADATMEELRASPDGRFLVFAAKTGGYAHLFRVDPDGANRQQLTFGENNQTDSAVSPDGRWIVYASGFFDGEKTHDSLQKIPSEGGDPIPLLKGFCLTPHFSYDGQMISCIEPDRIRIISFETGQTLKTFQPVALAALNSGARWTADGQAVAYRVSQNDVVNLWRQPFDGSGPQQLTNFTHGDIYNFTFSPDGSRIYLAHGNQVRNAILIRNIR